jgi:hypothetical protein
MPKAGAFAAPIVLGSLEDAPARPPPETVAVFVTVSGVGLDAASTFTIMISESPAGTGLA